MDIHPAPGQQNEPEAFTRARYTSQGQTDEAWVQMIAEEGYRLLFGLDDVTSQEPSEGPKVASLDPEEN